MKIVYDIKKAIDDSIKENKGINGVNAEFAEKLETLPIENRMLYPGKLYVMDYFTESKKLYDTKPYIMSLGPAKDVKGKFYGIDMHWIPYKIRLQIFGYIYDISKAQIQKAIAEFPDEMDSIKQPFLIEITTDLVKKSPFNVNISSCMHAYYIDKIADCRCVNWNMIHYMLLSDEDTFSNGTIKDAQEMFIEEMTKKQK